MKWGPRARFVFFCGLAALFSACSRPPFNPDLPDSITLGSPRGLRNVRVVTHFHSPYSNDACDKEGLTAGVPNAECLSHLRRAVCSSKIDLLFMTDHPANMASYEFSSLLLEQPGDEIVSTVHGPYYNRLADCGGGFRPKLFTGFEGRALGMGMTQHLEATVEDRTTLYNEDGTGLGALSTRLKADADALVAVPHSESRTLQWMKDLDPDAIEIYNYHANMDPKIRQKDLGLPPFGKMGWLLTYLLDPYSELTPDLAFLHFLEVAPIYSQKWREMIFSGFEVAGILGTDSHENILKFKASDGERVDSHRRLTRMMSLHVLAASTDPAAIKTAIRGARFWNVFEGFGSPVGMDFSASAGSDVAGVGETLNLTGREATLRVELPRLHSSSPWGRENPLIRIRLIELLSAAADGERVVAQTEGSSLSYATSTASKYRAEVRIVPRHLREFMGDFPETVDAEFPWIITNPIYLQ